MTAFTDPGRADDELELAERLLAGLHLRATTLTTRIAALIRDAGTDGAREGRARLLRADITNSGVAAAEATLELALCFHHAVTGYSAALQATTARCAS